MHSLFATLRLHCWPLLLLVWLQLGPAVAQPLPAASAPALELTDKQRAWLAQNHTVRARVSDYPPYMFRQPVSAGISVDYLVAAANRFGFKVEFLPDTLGFAAAVEDVSTARQHYDLLLTFTRTPEREKQLTITDDYLTAPWVVYARQDSPYIVGLENLSGKIVAAEKGFVMTGKLKSDYPAIQLLEVENSTAALMAVATGRAEAYVGNLANASYLIREHRLDNLVVAAPTRYNINTQAMAVRKDWPELAELINKSVAAMTLPQRAAINQKWGVIEVRPRIDYALVWQVVLVFSVILLAVLYWNRKRAEKAMLASATFAHTTIDAVPEHICVIDRNGFIVTINRAWREFHDRNFPDPIHTDYGIGLNYLDICQFATGSDAPTATRMEQGIRAVMRGEIDQFSIEYACDSPTEQCMFHARVTRFHGNSGNLLISHENITERKQAQEIIRLSEARLNRAELISKTGNWELHLDTRTMIASAGATKLYGLDHNTFDLALVQRMVLPQYRRHLDASLENLIEHDTPYDVEFKIRTADTGSLRDIHSLATFDRQQQILFGVIQDITDIKLAQDRLHESEMRYRLLAENSRDVIWTMDIATRRFTYISPSVEKLRGFSAEEVMAQPVEAALTPESWEFVNAAIQNTLRKLAVKGLRDVSQVSEIEQPHRDGHVVPTEVVTTWVLDESGTPRTILGVSRDITERRKAQEALQRMAHTDSLTGLDNRRHFMSQAEQELARTVRYGGQLSVLMMDIDHFKNINDTYGHQTGDLVIQTLAHVCQATLREIDIVGRIGGEEFAIVLPQTAGAQAVEAAQRLRLAIASTAVSLQRGLPLHFTVSIGVATLTDAPTNLDMLLADADKALYEAKHGGRNRVC